MRMSVSTWLRGFSRRSGLLPAVLFVLCLSGIGCASVNSLLDDTGKPDSEIVIQSGAYGTVTQVTSAAMQDKELRRGDIALTVDLDTGGVVVVIQPEDEVYTVGDRVRVIRGGQGFVRVQLLI